MLGLYLVFLIPPLVVGLVIQHRLKKAVNEQMAVAVANGRTAVEEALRRAGHGGEPRGS